MEINLRPVRIGSALYKITLCDVIRDDHGEVQDGMACSGDNEILLDKDLSPLRTLTAHLHEVFEVIGLHAGRNDEEKIPCNILECLAQGLASTMIDSPKHWDDLMRLASIVKNQLEEAENE